MLQQTILKLLFIHNPKAGGKHHYKNIWWHNDIEWESAVKKHLNDHPCQYEFYTIQGNKDEIASITNLVEKIQPDKIIAIGGDGTAKLVAEVAMTAKIPMCIFPAGSANGMAREIGMPENFEACMNTLLNGIPQYIDIICINSSQLCMHLSDIGINAQLVKYFEDNNLRGKLGYAKEIFKVLWRKHLMKVEIKTGEHEIKRKAFMVVLANAGSYGTGVRINPLSNIHDGIFEVVILRRLSLIELFKMLFFNRPFNPKKTEIIQAQSIEITVKHRIHFQVDGEYMGKTDSVYAAIKPNALQLIFPPKSF